MLSDEEERVLREIERGLQADHPHRARRLLTWLRRHRRVAVASAGVVFTLPAVAGGLSHQRVVVEVGVGLAAALLLAVVETGGQGRRRVPVPPQLDVWHARPTHPRTAGYTRRVARPEPSRRWWRP